MKRHEWRAVFLAVVFAFVFFSLYSIFSAVFGQVDAGALELKEFLRLLGRASGLVAFLALSILIVSGETARFFDRLFGMDGIIKFQRKFSLATALLVFSHPAFFILASGKPAFFLVPDFSVLPLAVGITAFYVFVLVAVASKFYKRVSHEAWQFLHVITYALFFLALYHAVNAGSDFGNQGIQVMYGVSLASVLAGIVYRTQYKARQLFRGKFFVKEVRRETGDTFTLVLRPEKPFFFKAGQFAFLRIAKAGLFARHPFSFSNAPSEGGELCFTIKMKGRFTKAASELSSGEEVKLEGPFGIFTFEESERNVVFIAGGVGIAPFMSLIESNRRDEKPRNITLVYGSRDEKNIIFKRELDAIKAKWFRKVYVLDELCGEEDCVQGPVSRSLLEERVSNPRGAVFYVCGPEKMKEAVKKTLAQMNVENNRIKIEDFFW